MGGQLVADRKIKTQNLINAENVVSNTPDVGLKKTGGPPKSAGSVIRARKEAKKAAEQAEKAAAEQEKNKYAHLPAWRRAMLEKKDKEALAAAQPSALELRRQEVEHMFDHLPHWQREVAVKKREKHKKWLISFKRGGANCELGK